MTLRFFLIMQVNAIDLLIEFIFIKKRYFSSLIHLKEMYFGEKRNITSIRRQIQSNMLTRERE